MFFKCISLYTENIKGIQTIISFATSVHLSIFFLCNSPVLILVAGWFEP